MVTNFEEETYELTDEEKSILPFVLKGFERYTKENPIKSADVVKKLNEYLPTKGYAIKITGARLRKFCNYIRVNGLLPLIGTSSGYYISYDKVEVQKQIKSLTERANSILRCSKGLEKYLK